MDLYRSIAWISISLQSSLVVTKHMINHAFVLVMVLTTPLTALTLNPLVNTSLSCPFPQILSCMALMAHKTNVI